MHDDADIQYGDIVTIKPNTRYAAGIWFETLTEKTVEWSRRLDLAHDRGNISLIEKIDTDELGNINLGADRHLYFDDEASSGMYFDSETGDLTASNGPGPALTIPSEDVAVAIDALDTDDLNNTTFIRPSSHPTVSDINSELTSAGRYVIVGDYSTLTDRIEPTADDIHLIIDESATISFADGASPTTETDVQGDTRTPIIWVGGYAVDCTVRGTIDGNVTNHIRPVPLFWINASGNVTGEEATLTNFQELWFVDNTGPLTVSGFDLSGARQTGIAAEGLDNRATLSNLYAEGTNGADEVIDLNAYCDGTKVRNIVGENISQAVVELNASPNCSITDVSITGETGTPRAVWVAGGSGSRYTTKSNPGHSDNVTVRGVSGTANYDANPSGPPGLVVVRGTVDPVRNCTVIFDGGVGGAGGSGRVLGATGEMDGLSVGGSALGYIHVYPNNAQGSVHFDDLQVTGAHVVVENAGPVSGNLTVRDSPREAFKLYTGTTGTFSGDITVIASNPTNQGVLIADGGSGTVQDLTLRGWTDSTVEIGANADGTRLDMAYSALTDNGTNTVTADYTAP